MKLAFEHHVKVYVCIHDARVDRMTEYMSDLDFTGVKFAKLKQSLAKNAESNVSIKTYVGQELSKPRVDVDSDDSESDYYSQESDF